MGDDDTNEGISLLAPGTALSFVFLHYPFRRNKVLVDDADDGAHGKKGEGEHVKAFAHLIK